MSEQFRGQFEIEDVDIVHLAGDSPTGWVNVGTHAVYLDLSDNHLIVEVYPRCNEVKPLVRLAVSNSDSRAKGGVDPDKEP